MISRRLLPALLLVGTALAASSRSVRADDPAPVVPPAPSPAPAPAPPPVPAPRPAAEASGAFGASKDWRVGDQLEIRVLGRPDLTVTVRVLADGTVDVPFAGRYRIAGRTIDELREDVERGFAKHERTPKVALTVGALAADEFYVLGEAGKAGVYAVPRFKRVTLLQAIGMAGGFGPEADFTRVQVVPASGGDGRVHDASPTRIAALSSVVVAHGDTIVIPSVGRIYLMGQVNRTGGFAPPAGERMTLTRALALAGGFTRLAEQGQVLVTWRTPSGEAKSARYNVKAILSGGAEDVQVFPGNLVFVPERLF